MGTITKTVASGWLDRIEGSRQQLIEAAKTGNRVLAAFAQADARAELIESLKDPEVSARLLNITDPELAMVELDVLLRTERQRLERELGLVKQEAALARDAVRPAAEPHHDVAEGPVVDVQRARPQHLPRIDAEGVAVMQVVVERRGQQVANVDWVISTSTGLSVASSSVVAMSSAIARSGCLRDVASQLSGATSPGLAAAAVMLKS